MFFGKSENLTIFYLKIGYVTSYVTSYGVTNKREMECKWREWCRFVPLLRSKKVPEGLSHVFCATKHLIHHRMPTSHIQHKPPSFFVRFAFKGFNAKSLVFNDNFACMIHMHVVCQNSSNHSSNHVRIDIRRVHYHVSATN